jgi:hypothetical protein
MKRESKNIIQILERIVHKIVPNELYIYYLSLRYDIIQMINYIIYFFAIILLIILIFLTTTENM